MDRAAALRATAVVGLLVCGVWAGVLAWDGLHETAPQAPDFTLTDTGYEDGVYRGPETFNLTDYRGQTVVLDFMAYNCGSCRFVTPRVMEPLHEEFGNRSDFAILTIDVGEFSNFPGSSTENLVKWQTQEYDSPWRHALDREGIFLDYVDLGAVGLPSVFVVDGDGDVVYAKTGVPSLAEVRGVVASSLAGEAETAAVLTVGIVGLAFVAGVASFFAPCSVGLIPAYMGFLLQRQARAGHRHATIPAGLATAAGIVSLYAVLAVVLWLFQDRLGAVVPYLGPVVGGLLVVLGVLMFVGFDWERVARLLGLGKVDGRRGFVAFGFGYGLAAFGCTGPIFLPLLVAGFAQGTTVGLLAFAAYAVAVASFVLLAAYLVGTGHTGVLKRMLSHTKAVTRVSAVLLVAAGAYLVWFDVTAFAPL